jgi:hypothetical protein
MAIRDTPSLTAATMPLLEDTDGYLFAFDPRIANSRRATDVPRLGVLASRVIARHGAEYSDGTRRADALFVTSRLFGPHFVPPVLTAVTAALDAEVVHGRVSRVENQFVVTRHDLVVRRPNAWVVPDPQQRAEVRPHWVVGFLRKLPIGWQASYEKCVAYRAARATGHVAGPAELPDGYTWVIGHERGGDLAAFADAYIGLVDDSGYAVDTGDLLAEIRVSESSTSGSNLEGV